MTGKSLSLGLAGAVSLIPAIVEARAARPDPLQDEAGCDHYRGTPIGANDPTQQFELVVCTTAEGVKAKVQTSSLESGWSVRQSVGQWDADGRVLSLRDTEFLESRPEPGWRFCLIDSMVLEKTDEGLVGHYVSEPCDDRAELRLTRLEPVEAAAPVTDSRAAPPAAADSTPPPVLEHEPRPSKPEPERGCACTLDDHRAPGSALLILLALVGRSRRRRMIDSGGL